MCTVFCDISKAFDKVWHRGLLKKIKAYGISGNLLHWPDMVSPYVDVQQFLS
jgi:hypothetical protein